VVVCAGGGGVPVIRDAAGVLHGVEAVIDKDLTAAVLARQLGVETLVVATDVDAVMVGWETPDAHPLGAVTVAELRKLEGSPAQCVRRKRARQVDRRRRA